jgi:hypothetical protein
MWRRDFISPLVITVPMTRLMRDFGGLDLDHAAIDHDGVSRFEILAEVGVVHPTGVLRGGGNLGLAAKLDGVAHLKLPGLLDIACADAGAGEVHEHGDLALGGGGGLADTGIDGAHPVVRGMAHVQADDVRPFGDEIGNDFGLSVAGPRVQRILVLRMVGM